jgi:hypothetical protein
LIHQHDQLIVRSEDEVRKGIYRHWRTEQIAKRVSGFAYESEQTMRHRLVSSTVRVVHINQRSSCQGWTVELTTEMIEFRYMAEMVFSDDSA